MRTTKPAATMLAVAGPLLLLTQTGCMIGCSKTWTQTVTEERTVSLQGARTLSIKTHNGKIAATGQADRADAQVTITKKAGANNMERALEALDHLEVYEETSGDTLKLGWRFNGIKARDWSGNVSFDVILPENLNVIARTHNGAVIVGGVTGAVDAETHNGPVKAASTGNSMRVETHNGKIDAAFTGRDVVLETHNGSITADLRETEALEGKLVTHNGGVKVITGDATSAKLSARTHNGSINVDGTLNQAKVSRRRLTATLASGEGSLDIVTHNGSVSLQRPSN